MDKDGSTPLLSLPSLQKSPPKLDLKAPLRRLEAAAFGRRTLAPAPEASLTLKLSLFSFAHLPLLSAGVNMFGALVVVSVPES